MAFFGLLEATEKIQLVDQMAPLIWSEEENLGKVVFLRRLPVKFVKRITKVIPIEEVLSWNWRRRYPPFNEYNWSGYSRLFAGSFLEEEQKLVIMLALSVDQDSFLLACDLEVGDQNPQKIKVETYRVLRDTALARQIKEIHNHVCQVCGVEPIKLSNGRDYSEAHHIMPLGKHNGPDIAGNIICVCPTCHVKLDYGAIRLQFEMLRIYETHNVHRKFVNYHNEEIFNKITV